MNSNAKNAEEEKLLQQKLLKNLDRETDRTNPAILSDWQVIVILSVCMAVVIVSIACAFKNRLCGHCMLNELPRKAKNTTTQQRSDFPTEHRRDNRGQRPAVNLWTIGLPTYREALTLQTCKVSSAVVL